MEGKKVEEKEEKLMLMCVRGVSKESVLCVCVCVLISTLTSRTEHL